MRWGTPGLTAAALLAVAVPAKAIQFQAVRLPGVQNSVVIRATEQLSKETSTVWGLSFENYRRSTELGLALDSAGGNLLEAEKLACFVKAASTSVAVLRGEKCASACFLIFVAGANKFVAPDALIGVHSAASEGGQETAESMAVTPAMARDGGNLGVPPAIVGKVIETQPGRMEWKSSRWRRGALVSIHQ